MVSVYETSVKGFTLRYATKEDSKLILDFIKGLADYQNMSSEVTATVEDIEKSVFEKEYCKVLIGEYENNPVGFCLFFYNFSTFLGKPTIHIEDIFFKPEVRGRGFGKKTFEVMSQIAQENDCGRIEWSCLNWNEPSIKFYEGMGAVQLPEWLIFRLDNEGIDTLGKNI